MENESDDHAAVVTGQRDEIGGGNGRVLQRRIAKPGSLVAAKRQRFLNVLAATANARRAAAAADAAVSAFYRLRARDVRFATAWQAALDEALVRLEGEVLAKALGEGGEGVGSEGTEGGGSEGSGDELVGDGEAAGAAGAIDARLAMEYLKRTDTLAAHGQRRATVAGRREVSVEDVVALLERRLEALYRRARR